MSNRVYEKMAEAVARLQRMLARELEPTGTTAAARVVVRLWPEVLERVDNGRVTAAELYAVEQRAQGYADQIQELEEAIREHEAHGAAYRRQIAALQSAQPNDNPEAGESPGRPSEAWVRRMADLEDEAGSVAAGAPPAPAPAARPVLADAVASDLSDAEKVDEVRRILLHKPHSESARAMSDYLGSYAIWLRAQAEPVDVFEAFRDEFYSDDNHQSAAQIAREWFGPALDFVRDYSHPECGPITSKKALAVLSKLDQRAREVGR